MASSPLTRRNFVAGAAFLAGAWLAPRSALAQETAAAAGAADSGLIEDLIAANRILFREGIVDGFGHVSVRHNRDSNRFLMARSLAPDLVTVADLIEYDLDGNPIDLRGRDQYSERFIHSEIYKVRPDVQAVVHNHSPAVVPFGVSSTPLRPIYHMAAFIVDSVPVFDIREAVGITNMLVNDAERGSALARALGDRSAILMRGHGVAVVGPSLPFAVARSVYLEMNARIQAQAMALAGEITYLDAREAQAMLDSGEHRGYERPWEMWKRAVTESPR